MAHRLIDSLPAPTPIGDHLVRAEQVEVLRTGVKPAPSMLVPA